MPGLEAPPTVYRSRRDGWIVGAEGSLRELALRSPGLVREGGRLVRRG